MEPIIELRNATVVRGRTRVFENLSLSVSRGEHTYVFRYRTGRQIRWFDGRPELNWNVTGNFWNFPILQVNHSLELAGGARPVRWAAYTGRLGARGIDWRATTDTSGALMVRTTRRLAPGEGLTVVAELPSDAVSPPSESQLLWYRLYDNRAWIFGGIGLFVVLGYYFAAWEAAGRDPKGGAVDSGYRLCFRRGDILAILFRHVALFALYRTASRHRQETLTRRGVH